MSKQLFCERCSLQFGKKYVFDLHLSLVHGEKIEVKVESPISEENLLDSKNRAKVLSHHVVEKQLKCDICKSVFKTKETLKRHIQTVHEGKKPFTCKICDTSFAKKLA